MAVVENGSSIVGHLETKAAPNSHVDGDLDNSKPTHFDTNDDGNNKDGGNGSDSESRMKSEDSPKLSDQSLNLKSQSLHNNTQLNGGADDSVSDENGGINHKNNGNKDSGNFVQKDYGVLTKSDDSSETVDDVNDDLADLTKGSDYTRNGEKGDDDDGIKKNIRDLKEMLSKLNPMAAEFVPSSIGKVPSPRTIDNVAFANNFLNLANAGSGNGFAGRRKKSNYGQGKRRMNARTSMAQREEVIRRTVYVSDIDHQVTEEQLAALFINCGQVVDCRVCGDPNSVLRFAFIEFTDEEGARTALALSGTMLGYYPVRVLPSKTAIAPVNPTFLPRSEDEREMCARTVYCTNIDKKVTQADVKLFFESLCGKVHRLRLLGDYHHSTRIAFVEFVMAESAIAALSCSGAVLGTLPIRVSPSKTPVRPRPPRPLH